MNSAEYYHESLRLLEETCKKNGSEDHDGEVLVELARLSILAEASDKIEAYIRKAITFSPINADLLLSDKKLAAAHDQIEKIIGELKEQNHTVCIDTIKRLKSLDIPAEDKIEFNATIKRIERLIMTNDFTSSHKAVQLIKTISKEIDDGDYLEDKFRIAKLLINAHYMNKKYDAKGYLKESELKKLQGKEVEEEDEGSEGPSLLHAIFDFLIDENNYMNFIKDHNELMAIIELCLQAGENVNARSRSISVLSHYLGLISDSHNKNLGRGDKEVIEIVQLLIANGANVNAIDNYGWIDLHNALELRGSSLYFKELNNCNRLDIGVVKALIDAGSDVNVLTEEMFTPLSIAVRNFDLDSIELLLEAGADPNVLVPDDTGDDIPLINLALGLFFECDSLDNVKQLIRLFSGAGVDINVVDDNGNIYFQKMLEDASANLVSLEAVELLLASGADVNYVNPDCEYKELSPLQIAAKEVSDLVPLLIRYGADISYCDNNGRKAYDYYKGGDPFIKKALKEGL